MPDLYDELEFPPKAEYLDLAEYVNYQVDIAHWKEISAQFQKVFRQVYARRSAAVLLVYGPQGSGKSLFCMRLLKDYKNTSEEKDRGGCIPNLKDNLWHVLVATTDPEEDKIREATANTTLEKVDDQNSSWLTELRAAAKKDTKHRVRIYLLDNAARDSMLRPWTELNTIDFAAAKQAGPDAVLGTVAQRIDAACRSDFQRSILVLLSNDRPWLEAFQRQLDQWYKGLATLIDLPVPPPRALEHIVRINTNRLNRVSYWYCLEAALPDKRREVRNVLMSQQGFTDSFDAVSSSLASSPSRRRGKPSNRNALTLVTLGVEQATVHDFLAARDFFIKEEVKPRQLHGATSRHLGVWEIWGPWASKITSKRPPSSDFLRRARMLESEFLFQWISLDMVATCALLEPPAEDDLGGRILELIERRPSTGEKEDAREAWRNRCAQIEADLYQPPFPPDRVDNLVQEFARGGQSRSAMYEAALKRRVGARGYGRGVQCYPALRPDLIADRGEYRACELTGASSDNDKDIAEAIVRTGHSIEFTAFLRENLDGLEAYLIAKVEAYAAMLESV